MARKKQKKQPSKPKAFHVQILDCPFDLTIKVFAEDGLMAAREAEYQAKKLGLVARRFSIRNRLIDLKDVDGPFDPSPTPWSHGPQAALSNYTSTASARDVMVQAIRSGTGEVIAMVVVQPSGSTTVGNVAAITYAAALIEEAKWARDTLKDVNFNDAYSGEELQRYEERFAKLEYFLARAQGMDPG